MPITIEELTADVVPEAGRRGNSRTEAAEVRAGDDDQQLAERLRAALALRQRRAERLCDR